MSTKKSASKVPTKPAASKPASKSDKHIVGKPKEEPKEVEDIEDVEDTDEVEEQESENESESQSEAESENESEPVQEKKRQDDPPPKPLSEEDVMDIMSRLSSLDSKDINEICDGFSQKIKALVNLGKKKLNPKTDEDEIVELERIMRLINMCPKDELFIRSKDKIWHARYHILDRDSNWFLNRDYSASIKKDNKQRMIETIIRLLQKQWKALSEEERETYWEKAFEILQLVGRYKKLTNER